MPEFFKRYWIALTVGSSAIVVSALCCCGGGVFFGLPAYQRSTVTASVKQGIENKEGVTIKEIHLIRKGDSYQGIATTSTGIRYEITDVVSGGGQTQWRHRKVEEQAKNEADKKGAPAKIETGKIGDEVLLTDSKWVVLKAEDKSNTLKAVNRFSKDATTTGRFVLVHFKVTNLSNKEVQIDKAVLVDSLGREFNTIGEQYKYLPKEAKKLDIFNPLPASVPKEFYGIYEVPADADGLRFKARDMRPFDSKEYRLVELGF